VKGVLADAFAQHVIEGRRLIAHDAGGDGAGAYSVVRTLSFAVFSGAYLGCGQHLVYNVAFTRLFGASSSLATGAKKVAADAIIHVPFICERLRASPATFPSAEASTGRPPSRDPPPPLPPP